MDQHKICPDCETEFYGELTHCFECGATLVLKHFEILIFGEKAKHFPVGTKLEGEVIDREGRNVIVLKKAGGD